MVVVTHTAGHHHSSSIPPPQGMAVAGCSSSIPPPLAAAAAAAAVAHLLLARRLQHAQHGARRAAAFRQATCQCVVVWCGRSLPVCSRTTAITQSAHCWAKRLLQLQWPRGTAVCWTTSSSLHPLAGQHVVVVVVVVMAATNAAAAAMEVTAKATVEAIMAAATALGYVNSKATAQARRVHAMRLLPPPPCRREHSAAPLARLTC
jgi:hypothetical protein